MALARILLAKPRILMLDEPFAALDEFLRWKLELEDIIKEFGGTTLFVSHNRDEIYRICDRVCVMNRGQSSEAVPIKELFAAPVSREFFRCGGDSSRRSHGSGLGNYIAV